MRIRSAHPEDAAGIRAVNISAFGTRAEADLVEVLCERASPIISLVADDDGAIAGHILFTPMTLDADRELKVMGLAPMAVATGRQRQGIGTAEGWRATERAAVAEAVRRVERGGPAGALGGCRPLAQGGP